MINLLDQFDDFDTEDFTNFNYIEQLIVNGQWSVLKDFLKKVDNIGLVNLIRNHNGRGGSHFADEITRRLEKC